jgi:hypothetical protein
VAQLLSLGHIMRVAYFIRLVLIIGAAACFVIGVKMVAQDIVYHVNFDPFEFVFTVFPFIPIIAMAPRYKDGRIIYSFIGAAEVLSILMNFFIVLR